MFLINMFIYVYCVINSMDSKIFLWQAMDIVPTNFLRHDSEIMYYNNNIVNL